MSLHYSKYYKVPHRSFFQKGVFDGMLDVDSHLHIDPLLLKNCSVPEFVGAYDEFLDYFNKFLHLVPHVKVNNVTDRFYRQIVNRFTFKEISNTGLGFSKTNTNGRGISGALSQQLADTAIDIISAGYKDSEVFLLMPIFEDNISMDRISDMTIAILIRRIVKYTARMAAELGVKTTKFTTKSNDEPVMLPVYNRKPVLFLPTEILANIPIATSYEDIDRVVNYATRLKRRVAEAIGVSWSQYRYYKKNDWKNAIFNNPKGYQEAMSYFKGLKAKSYDFSEDKNDEYLTARLQDMTVDCPLDLLQFFNGDNTQSVYHVASAILDQFKKLVEDNYMWKIFNRKGRKPDETDWQYYLLTVADTYIKASEADVDVTRENNPGPGEIDFKFTRGTTGKTVVELKRSSNKDMLHGYVSQLPAYMKAESAEYGIFMIIKEDDKNNEEIQKVLEYQRSLVSNGESSPVILVVDARPKKSASNL